MAKYYATGTQKVKRKNDEGKMETTVINVVVNLDQRVVRTRLDAVVEANRIAKLDGVTIDGVHLVKGTEKGANTLTKNIQTKRTNGTLPKF